MKYSLNYQQLHDIDWFFQSNGTCYHVASNGGKLPLLVEKKRNIKLQELIEVTPFLISEKEIMVLKHDYDINYNSFIQYARKGFVSIDKIRDEFDAQNYQVIARPTKHIIIPNEITQLIPKFEGFTLRITDIDRTEYNLNK